MFDNLFHHELVSYSDSDMLRCKNCSRGFTFEEYSWLKDSVCTLKLLNTPEYKTITHISTGLSEIVQVK